MDKKTLFFIFSALLAGACAPESETLPIPLEEAAMIIVDTHVAEAALQNVYGARKDSLASVYYQQIYTIHGIDSITYHNLIWYLRNNPDQREAVYDKAFEEMKARPESSK
jgi:hypothetical protein